MLQESIYVKLILNPPSAELCKKQVRREVPQDGLVQMLMVTEKQFASMELLVGKKQMVYVDNDKRLIEL